LPELENRITEGQAVLACPFFVLTGDARAIFPCFVVSGSNVGIAMNKPEYIHIRNIVSRIFLYCYLNLRKKVEN